MNYIAHRLNTKITPLERYVAICFSMIFSLKLVEGLSTGQAFSLTILYTFIIGCFAYKHSLGDISKNSKLVTEKVAIKSYWKFRKKINAFYFELSVLFVCMIVIIIFDLMLLDIRNPITIIGGNLLFVFVFYYPSLHFRLKDKLITLTSIDNMHSNFKLVES
jgi:hypothetical protein